MNTLVISESEVLSDSELVALSLTGDRDAFGAIVVRYQSLICALAYSACGDLTRSEDCAQEVFLAAWRQLSTLREPDRLKGWLCGIARNLLNNSARRDLRNPVANAQPLSESFELADERPGTPGDVISKEEESILWRVLEGLPRVYREPMVLFYRQDQSTAEVADTLGISEEAARQRLSRGRALLNERVAKFVESTLMRSGPTKAFTLGVLAALPALACSATAATVGATAAQGSAVAKSAALVTVSNAVFGPVVGIVGSYIGLRASLDATRTPRERSYVIRQTKLGLLAALIFNVVLAGYIFFAVKYWTAVPWVFAALGLLIPLGFTGFIIIAAARFNRQVRQLREEEKQLHPELFQAAELVPPAGFKEYRSRWTLLGLPLVHMRIGAPAREKVRPAVGWIALGDRAYGVLFAGGGFACGGISFGGVSVGLIALGGASVGVLAIGGFALGAMAIGGAAVGLLAAGGLATAWLGAEGGLAVAREFALGGAALARHANDAAAAEFFSRYPWMDMTTAANRNWFVTIAWLPMLLVAWHSVWARRKSKNGTRYQAQAK